MVQNGIDPNNNLGIQRFSYLDIPSKYQCLTGNTILILTGRSLLPLSMLIIDTMQLP